MAKRNTLTARMLGSTLVLGMVASFVVGVATGPGLVRARAADVETGLQGSWQGHPTATTCTGILASPCPLSFYTMTTFIPDNIAYGSPQIPGASPGHGRWEKVAGQDYHLKGQIFISPPGGTPIFRGITEESIHVDGPDQYSAHFKITILDLASEPAVVVVGTLEGLSVNHRLR